MNILLIIGFVFIAGGVIGSVLPFIPGPVLSYIALLLLSRVHEWKDFTPSFLIVLGAIVVVVTALSYILPRFTGKQYGASAAGLWCAVIGLFAGLMFIPPYGLFIGAACGAILGELLSRREKKVRSLESTGALVGTVIGILYRLSVSGIIASFFIRSVRAQ